MNVLHPPGMRDYVTYNYVIYFAGVDLSANQEEVCEKSTFQMEYDKTSGKWAFMTCVENKYWSLESFGGIQAACMTM